MRYLVLRSIYDNAHAILGRFELNSGVPDESLRTGAYVPVDHIGGGDIEISPGLTVQGLIDKHFDLLVAHIVPVVVSENHEWRYAIDPYAARSIRLAMFANEFQETLDRYCPLRDRVAIVATADIALHRLYREYGQPAFAIKSVVYDYLREEEDAKRCRIGGYHNFKSHAGDFLLNRLLPKFGMDRSKNPDFARDIRLVFNGVLLARVIDEERRLTDRFQADLDKSIDIEEILNCHLPNTIKPR